MQQPTSIVYTTFTPDRSASNAVVLRAHLAVRVPIVARGDVVAPPRFGDMLGGSHAASSPSKNNKGGNETGKQDAQKKCRGREGKSVPSFTRESKKFGTKTGRMCHTCSWTRGNDRNNNSTGRGATVLVCSVAISIASHITKYATAPHRAPWLWFKKASLPTCLSTGAGALVHRREKSKSKRGSMYYMYLLKRRRIKRTHTTVNLSPPSRSPQRRCVRRQSCRCRGEGGLQSPPRAIVACFFRGRPRQQRRRRQGDVRHGHELPRVRVGNHGHLLGGRRGAGGGGREGGRERCGRVKPRRFGEGIG